MLKVGDKVNVEDVSWSFGIYKGRYSPRMPYGKQGEVFIVIQTGLDVMKDSDGARTGSLFEQCDLLVTDEHGGYWFTQSENCKLVNKEIEVRYFSDGKDVTDRISDETKRNLKSL